MFQLMKTALPCRGIFLCLEGGALPGQGESPAENIQSIKGKPFVFHKNHVLTKWFNDNRAFVTAATK